MLAIEVRDPDDAQAARALRAYFTYLSTSYEGRAVSETEVDDAMAHSVAAQLRPPAGLLLVAADGDEVLGCGGLRLHPEDGWAEIKHLYVADAARRRGLASQLMARLEEKAFAGGAGVVRLDTRGDLLAARRLYERIGYREIPAYNENPFAAHWFEKTLRGSA